MHSFWMAALNVRYKYLNSTSTSTTCKHRLLAFNVFVCKRNLSMPRRIRCENLKTTIMKNEENKRFFKWIYVYVHAFSYTDSNRWKKPLQFHRNFSLLIKKGSNEPQRKTIHRRLHSQANRTNCIGNYLWFHSIWNVESLSSTYYNNRKCTRVNFNSLEISGIPFCEAKHLKLNHKVAHNSHVSCNQFPRNKYT